MTFIYRDVNEHTPTSKPFVEDLESVQQSITNILATKPGERLFKPEFGIDLEKYLFTIMSESTTFAIFDEIIVSIGRWEPRIKILYPESYVQPDYDNNTYDIFLTFVFRNRNDKRFNYVGKLKTITRG